MRNAVARLELQELWRLGRSDRAVDEMLAKIRAPRRRGPLLRMKMAICEAVVRSACRQLEECQAELDGLSSEVARQLSDEERCARNQEKRLEVRWCYGRVPRELVAAAYAISEELVGRVQDGRKIFGVGDPWPAQWWRTEPVEANPSPSASGANPGPSARQDGGVAVAPLPTTGKSNAEPVSEGARGPGGPGRAFSTDGGDREGGSAERLQIQ